MKEIKTFAFDKTVVQGSQCFVNYIVTGDPGSVFSMVITNEDANYYNFPENTIISLEEDIVTPSGSFTSTPSKLSLQQIDDSGVYYGIVHLPKVTSNDVYHTVMYAEASFNTVFNKSLSNGLVYLPSQIDQIIDTSLTFSLSSTANSGDYNTLPSNVVATGISTIVSKGIKKREFSISWPVTLSDDDLLTHFVIARQPVSGDFYISTTKDTFSAGSGTSLELKDITGLSIGMAVSGTGIASGATITNIISGYKDLNKSTPAKPVYVIPKAAGDNQIVDSPGGTVILSASSTFVADRTITFKGYGYAVEDFNSTRVNIKNFKLVIDPVVTTTDAAVSNSTTIPLTSTKGIKAAETVLMTGVGVTTASPHVDAISNGVNVTVSSAQTIENGQTITFTGSSRSAKITADVTVARYGNSNLTLTLELDNILTVA